MSSTPPSPRRRLPDLRAWRPSSRALLWVLLAFVAGLALFLLVWSGKRGQPDFYRVGDTPPTAAGPDYAPLPAPLPAARDSVGSGFELPQTGAEPGSGDTAGRARLEEPPAPPPVAPEPPPRTIATAPRAVTPPEPLAGRTPAPRYPRQALRRGEGGTVIVRVDVGPDGVPTSVSLSEGSGSPLLDRAAQDAVKRWRFRPATQDGRPTVGTVRIPIEFRAD